MCLLHPQSVCFLKFLAEIFRPLLISIVFAKQISKIFARRRASLQRKRPSPAHVDDYATTRFGNLRGAYEVPDVILDIQVLAAPSTWLDDE